MVIWEHEGSVENTSRKQMFSKFLEWPEFWPPWKHEK